jgi:hypothetical protein
MAKTAYFRALRAEMPELMKIATGKEERPPELDTVAAAFAVAGERQEQGADEATLVLLKRFSGNPDVQNGPHLGRCWRTARLTFHARSNSHLQIFLTGWYCL